MTRRIGNGMVADPQHRRNCHAARETLERPLFFSESERYRRGRRFRNILLSRTTLLLSLSPSRFPLFFTLLSPAPSSGLPLSSLMLALSPSETPVVERQAALSPSET